MKDFLKVKGPRILGPDGFEIFLRGFCLGGWLMQENFITGFPGTEQEFRKALSRACGKERATLYFQTFLENFITEEDFAYMKNLGVTAVRVPFNHRHFEAKQGDPKKFNIRGLRHLDRVVRYCKRSGIHAILDMHAVPGHQNADWHSDNFFNVPFFWQERFYREKFMALWELIADHYKNEPAVAGYDLMNEPVAEAEEAKKVLNQVYQETVKRIRKIDKRHIIFLKGNLWGQDFSSFDPPFAEGLVYSAHFYSALAAKGQKYPARINGKRYDRSSLEQEMDIRDGFTRKHKVPLWIGEFGAEFTYPDATSSKIRLLNDQISIFHERGYSWTLWTYKDVDHMSMVYIAPSSDYMRFTSVLKNEKVKLGCDLWHSSGKSFQDLVGRIMAYAEPELGAYETKLRPELTRALGQVFSRFVLDQFVRKISKLSGQGIKKVLSSFQFKKCRVRKELHSLLKAKLGRQNEQRLLRAPSQ